MIEHNEKRERRIQDEAIVDAYGSQEQALGWYYYLEEQIIFPFKTPCTYSHKAITFKVAELVKVLVMAGKDDCTSDMIVIVQFQARTLGVPVAQLEPIAGEKAMTEAMTDLERGLVQWMKE
ncbi:MAG: calcium-binding protein [Anaerolineae bacterium]